MSLFWIMFSVLSTAICVEGSWGTPGSSTQYHIQTDEGPERYFRFQTDNGQFRKEKRLQDGTVIGTEAWIDAAGFLRQKDYIADSQGYRILKSKTVFVGQGRAIDEAIKSTKTVPAKSGIRVGSYISPNSIDQVSVQKHNGFVYATTPIPATLSTRKTVAPGQKLGYLSPSEAAKLEPSPYLGYDHYPNELSSGGIAAAAPSRLMEPPYASKHRYRVRPIAVLPTPPPAIAAPPAPSEFGYYYDRKDVAQQNYNDGLSDAGKRTASESTAATTAEAASLPLDINNLVVLQPPHLPTVKDYNRRSRPQQPTTLEQSNSLAEATTPESGVNDGSYDGVSMTRNGFRYFLPRQYHEEEQVSGTQRRAGSFGYIDPFGIRRVVYYNASPEHGFVHRKNSRYVGFGAAPYDERI